MKEIYKEDLHTDMRSLQDLGFESHEAKAYLSSSLEMKMIWLKKKRCLQLEDIHRQQKKLDTIDYMIYRIKQEEQQ